MRIQAGYVPQVLLGRGDPPVLEGDDVNQNRLKMKQRIKNTIAFALLAVTFAVTVADPFGAGSAAQYAANFAAICICIPAAAVLLVNNKAKKEES